MIAVRFRVRIDPFGPTFPLLSSGFSLGIDHFGRINLVFQMKDSMIHITEMLGLCRDRKR